jgi:hypothetical protein
LSEFMKSIVSEVLKPTQKPKDNPIFGGESRFIYSKSAVNKQSESKQDQAAIPGISRPNYQQKNSQKRLAGIPVPSSVKTDHLQTKPVPVKNSSSQPVNRKVHDSLSKLQTISLVQGNHPMKKLPHHREMLNKTNEESQFIGQSRDGVKAWIFSGLHPNLLESFQRSIKSHHIGVVTSDKCTVGQLFLLNEILRVFPSMKYCLTWDRESKQGFVLELYDDHKENLTKAVKTMFQKLSQNSYKSLQMYTAHSPGPWLTKQLGLKTYVEGAAVLEGIDYYSAILLLDKFLKKSPGANFGYAAETNYLLLHGEYAAVTKAAEEMLKKAERMK